MINMAGNLVTQLDDITALVEKRLDSFHLILKLEDLIYTLTSKNKLVRHNKQHHRKVLLSSFHLNGHTLGFYTQTQKQNHLVQHNKQHHRKVLLSSFHLNGHS